MTRAIQTSITSAQKIERKTYDEKIRLLFGNALIAYYPMDETSGTVAEDVAGSNRDGTYKNATLDYYTSPVNTSAPKLSGTGSTTNVLVAGLKSAFTGQENTIAGWFKAVDFFDRTAVQRGWSFGVDGNNSFYWDQYSAADNVLNFSYKAGGTLLNKLYPFSTDEWFHVIMTWSLANDRYTIYVNGVWVHELNSLGTWAGTLTSADFGSYGNGSLVNWRDGMSNILILNREITSREAILLYNHAYFYDDFSGGDGEPATSPGGYTYYLQNTGGLGNVVISDGVLDIPDGTTGYGYLYVDIPTTPLVVFGKMKWKDDAEGRGGSCVLSCSNLNTKIYHDLLHFYITTEAWAFDLGAAGDWDYSTGGALTLVAGVEYTFSMRIDVANNKVYLKIPTISNPIIIISEYISQYAGKYLFYELTRPSEEIKTPTFTYIEAMY